MMNYNWNGVIDFLKSQIRDCNIREEQWQLEKIDYQKRIVELEKELKDVKQMNVNLLERIKSIQFAFQPLTENVKKAKKKPKVGHHRVKSDMDHNQYTNFQFTQPLIHIEEKKKEKKPLLLNFLKDLEIDDQGSQSTRSLNTQSLNIQIQPNSTKISQILINQTNYTTFNSVQSPTSVKGVPTNILKKPSYHHHQRSNSNGVIISQLRQQSRGINWDNIIQNDRRLSECQIVVGQNVFEPQAQLRSHLDGVRSIILSDNYLISGSEDCTIKIWDIKQNTQINDQIYTEPLCTLRKILGPVMTLSSWMNINKNGNVLQIYSGGVDGQINCIQQNLQNENDIKKDNSIFWKAHQNVIWQLKHHPIEKRLLSVSSDSTIKMWKLPDIQQNLDSNQFEVYNKPLGTYTYRNNSLLDYCIPTSVDWVQNESKEQIISGFVDQKHLVIFDVETTKIVSQVNFISEFINENVRCQPNKIIYHKERLFSIGAHDDNKIRFLDIRSNKVIKCLVSHTDSVTDITILPMNPDQIASVSHDGSLRTWDIRKFQCIQEMPVHKRKYDESIHTVNANQSVLATGGADGIVKLFRISQNK